MKKMGNLNHKKVKNSGKLSELLAEFVDNLTSEKVSVKEIINYFGDQGFFLLLIIFALPTAIPLPYPPGLTILTGLPLIILAVQMLLYKRMPSLPRWIMSFQIKTTLIIKIVQKILPYIYKMENITTPRILILSSMMGEKVIGVISLICAIFIASPLFFAHLIPAIGIILMCLGFINRDGIVIIIGIITSITGIVIASIVLYFTLIGGKFLLNKVL
jgi:hypothetical protein